MRKFNVLASGLVAATVLAGLGASAVSAAPKKINTESGLSCLVKIDDKLSIAYTPGTTMTFKDSDGHTETYTCDGNTGNWVKTSRIVPTRMLSLQDAQPVTRAMS